jgi:hypothetical protein
MNERIARLNYCSIVSIFIYRVSQSLNFVNGSHDSSVGIVTRIRTGRRTNRGSVSGKEKCQNRF